MDTRKLVRRTLEGDLIAFDELSRTVPASWPRDVTDPPPVLTARGVRSVLEGLKDGAIDPQSAGRWAGFVRWGELGEWAESTELVERRGRTPLHIDYESAHENGIVEAIALLDESGEDGPIPYRRLEELMANL